ncbi:MAG: histidine phosphatase family protein [Chloroflexi bacterium]|nr:histidine phosphatase family protein [Chloroflexota bacterium]
MGKWYLVRHGETAWNREGRVQGHTDKTLGEAGLVQAERVAARLATVSFAAAYCSDLKRTVETAEAVLRGRGVPLRQMAELREADHGEWEGLTYREVQDRYPERFAQFMSMQGDISAPGGESAADVLKRACIARDRLIAAHPDDDLLVVAHSGSLRALVVALLDLPLEASWRFRIEPCSVSIVSMHRRGATLELWNDVTHLEPAHER